MPTIIKAIYEPTEQGWARSEMQISAPTSAAMLSDLDDCEGWVEENGQTWRFVLRLQGNEGQLQWTDPAYRLRPARLVVEEPIVVGSYLERIDHGTDRVDEYRIVEIRESQKTLFRPEQKRGTPESAQEKFVDNKIQIEFVARKFYGCLQARHELQLARPDLAAQLTDALARLESEVKSLGGSIKIVSLESGEPIPLVLFQDMSVVDPSVCSRMDVERIITGYLNSQS